MNTKGVIIKEMRAGDNDKLFTVFSEDLGKIRVSARGARRPNSKLHSAQFLCYSSFTLYKSSKGYSLNECETIESFHSVTADIESLSLASYFAEILCLVTQEKIADKRLLSLFLNSLYVLSKRSVPHTLVKAVFELRCACLMGYTPYLDACIICGGEVKSFSVSDGGMVCDNCNGGTQGLDDSSILALKYIIGSPDKNIFSFKVSEAILNEIAPIAEEYLLSCCEFTPNSLEMYKKLFTI